MSPRAASGWCDIVLDILFALFGPGDNTALRLCVDHSIVWGVLLG